LKKIIALLVLFILFGCTAPPIVTDTPTRTDTPVIPTNTPTRTDTPTILPNTTTRTDTPAAPTETPVVSTINSSDLPFLPNPAWQPGVYNPDVTQESIHSTICVSGYSSSIRPSVSYTDKIKVQQIKIYGYADTNTANYEEDHLIPLEVGGSPADPMNLWPQPRHTSPYNASTKDTLENVLHGLVCSGQLSLDTARQEIATDWVAAYHKYVGQSILEVTAVPTEP
jgi:hypothetical protein